MGQVSLLRELRENIRKNYESIKWIHPSYNQLLFILSLCENHLMVKGETKCPVPIKKLSFLIFQYGNKKNFKQLVESEFNYTRKQPKNNGKSDKVLYNENIQLISQILKHWIQYKVPKWLSVINSLQELVCKEEDLIPGNYLHYASNLENEFLTENLTILLEYGVPASAIYKLKDQFNSDISQDEVLSIIQKHKLYQSNKLLEYEQYKLEKLIKQ